MGTLRHPRQRRRSGADSTEGTDANLWSVADVEEQVRSSVPLGRLGEPGDVARAVLWLCSRKRSGSAARRFR